MRARRRSPLVPMAVALAVLGLTACGGPRHSIDVSVKEIPGDVAIGKKKTVLPNTTLPPTVNTEPVAFPSFLQSPAPIRFTPDDKPLLPPTTSPNRQPKCRAANPLDAPKVDAPRNVVLPPANQRLDYRSVGSFEVVDRSGSVQKGPYPPLSARQLQSSDDGDGTYTVAVAEGVPVTVTTYHLDPAKGLYLRGVYSYRADGSADSFSTAVDSILLLPFPVTEGATVGGAGVDALSATTMTLTGTVVGKTKVDACGTPLAAWEVQITEGRVTSPNKQVAFTATYDIATQYGGISVRDVVEDHCDDSVNTYCDDGRKVTTQNTETVSTEPKPPIQPKAAA